jgi:Overcoming lysogenization defect protein-like, TOPRIM domain
VNAKRRRELSRDVLLGYVSGPAATTQATARALEKVKGSAAVVLVEGISDQIALETLAVRLGHDLEAGRVVILPIGGAQAIVRYLPALATKRLAGLCDAAEEEIFRRGLAKANLGSPQTREDLERLGFYVCVEDLESELIRAVRPARVEALFDTHGDLGSFRTLQKQDGWRTKSVEAQMRRFLGSGARRKLRYARLLVTAAELERVPHPLHAVLAHVVPNPPRRSGRSPSSSSRAWSRPGSRGRRSA